MLTFEQALDVLGLEAEYVDDTVRRNVTQKMAAAEAAVLGAVGKDVETYLPGDARITELQGAYLEDLYSQRGVSAKVSGAVRHLMHTLEWQLKLELSAAKRAAEAVSTE